MQRTPYNITYIANGVVSIREIGVPVLDRIYSQYEKAVMRKGVSLFRDDNERILFGVPISYLDCIDAQGNHYVYDVDYRVVDTKVLWVGNKPQWHTWYTLKYKTTTYYDDIRQ